MNPPQSQPLRSNKRQNAFKKNSQIPSIIRPIITPRSTRKLVDSSLSRPTSSYGYHEPQPSTVELDIQTPRTISAQERQKITEPMSSRSSSILNLLPELRSDGSEVVLDQIIQVLKKCDSKETEFSLYHVLTQEMLRYIVARLDHPSSELIKALSIMIIVVPISDRPVLTFVIQALYNVSKVPMYDEYFVSLGLIPLLIDHMYMQVGDISMYSAAILRHLSSNDGCCIEMIRNKILLKLIKTIRTDVRIDRFTEEESLFVYQVIELFAQLFDVFDEISLLEQYPVPLYILQLAMVYSSNSVVRSALARILDILLAEPICIESLEAEDLTPIFSLLSDEHIGVKRHVLSAMSNAMQTSALVCMEVVQTPPPLGIEYLCKMAINGHPNDVVLSIMRCLSKASEYPLARKTIFSFINQLTKYLDLQLDYYDEWTTDEMIVSNMLIILKNIAIEQPKDVALLVQGKMNNFMYYGVIDYAIDLMRAIDGIPEGNEAIAEVEHIDEVALVFKR